LNPISSSSSQVARSFACLSSVSRHSRPESMNRE